MENGEKDGGARQKKVAKRLLLGRKSGAVKTNLQKTKLGENAGKTLLADRACPEAQSPKRQVPMEVDMASPAKKTRAAGSLSKRKGCGRGKASLPPPNQPLLTEVWGSGSANRKGEEEIDG